MKSIRYMFRFNWVDAFRFDLLIILKGAKLMHPVSDQFFNIIGRTISFLSLLQ